MSVAQYPTPLNSAHLTEPDGPGPGGTSLCGFKLERLVNEYPSVIVKLMVDGGATYGADSATAVARWRLTYTGMTAAQAAVLDAHHDSARHNLLGFDFRDPRTGTLYSDVHYESYEYPGHTLYSVQSRVVTLAKRPA